MNRMTSSSIVTESSVLEAKMNEDPQKKMKTQVIWHNVLLLSFLHVGFLYSAYIWLAKPNYWEYLFQFIVGLMGGIGITAGSHRLWCHRSYKAKLPLRILLACFISIAAETDIYVWCRDHRVHHKFSETDADPHNIKRGFFFAHMGWLMCKKHPDVISKGKTVYLEDLKADPVVRFQRRFHIPLCLFFSLYLPTILEHHFFDQTQLDAFFHCIGRYVVMLHGTWLVNSAAHTFGQRPFDTRIAAADNVLVAFLAQGEGWHNYHHVFPWDYSTSELGNKLNLTKLFIDLMAFFGLAYDLKTATKKEILGRKLRTGDGTRIEKDE